MQLRKKKPEFRTVEPGKGSIVVNFKVPRNGTVSKKKPNRDRESFLYLWDCQKGGENRMSVKKENNYNLKKRLQGEQGKGVRGGGG